MPRLLHWFATLTIALAMTACGGGGGGGGDTEAPAAARIEAGPAAVLLTASGASRTLQAQLLDAAGAPVAGAINWTSSDPAAVAVDASGTVRALTGAGSARVTASSGALQSNSVLVTIAQPAAGVQLLADGQVVSGPTAVDPGAEPSADNPYEVVLRNVPSLAVGALLVASESANVAGRVLSAQPEGSNQRVRLEAVPPSQLFSAFEFRDSVDLAQGPFEIPADVAAVYDVVQTGSTFAFTPKPGAVITGSSRLERKMTTGAATGTFALPPFRDCKSDVGFASGQPSPIGLSAPPSFTVTIDGTARTEANAQGSKVIVTGKPKFKLTSVLEVKAAFEAKLGCKLTWVTRKFRVPGWAGLFFGGDVEFGLGFEVGGKFTLVNAKVGGVAELASTLEATLDCPVEAPSCTLGGNASAQTALTPQWQAPNLNQAQFEPRVNLFGFVTLEAGNADIQQLQFKAIEIKAGAELAASLAPELLQIINATDSGRSKYALAFKAEVGPGVQLGGFLRYLGLARVVPLKLAFEAPLGESPKATSVSADRARYLLGETVAVTVRLDAASTQFPSGLAYNVERVLLRRRSGLDSTELLAQQAASSGQTEFTFSFPSPGLLDAGEIFAFVVTKALPLDPPALELAAATLGATASDQLRHRGLTIERSSDIEVLEPDGSVSNIAPFDDRVRVEDENNSPPFVGSLSSTVQMPTGLTATGSLTLSAASEADTVTVDAQSGAVRTITMTGRAACNTNLQSEPDKTRRVLGVDLFSRYDAGRGVVIGPAGATVVISANLAVSPLTQFGSRQASATIGVLNGSTFEQFDVQTTNDALQPAFNRTVVMPAGGTVDVDLDARVACLIAEGGADQNHTAEASFTISITPN
jgi:hypothetical protein